MPERDAKDYAIEFGGYLADSASNFLDALNKSRTFANVGQDEYMDHWRALQSAIYEFRKRQNRAAAT